MSTYVFLILNNENLLRFYFCNLKNYRKELINVGKRSIEEHSSEVIGSALG